MKCPVCGKVIPEYFKMIGKKFCSKKCEDSQDETDTLDLMKDFLKGFGK